MAESKPDPKGLRWIDINDFSPGIFDNSLEAFSTPVTPPPGVFPAPMGAASATGTFGCMSLPNGGLGPGPALGGTPPPTGLTPNDIGIGSQFTSGGDVTALANSFATQLDELVIGCTPTPAGGNQTTTFFSYVVATSSLNTITSATKNFSAGNKAFCCFPFTTSLFNFASIRPAVVLPLTAPSGPAGNLMVYPDPAAPTAFGVASVDASSGPAFGHQGRIVAIQGNVVSWPFTTFTANPYELFNYTDPPLTTTYPGQHEVFGPENPQGYGALSSVSAGELFAIKARGGAIIIQGDLNNPTITTLPSVKSTGPIYGRPDTDGNGTYYCSQDQGAWVWGGGNTSSKISPQLDDRFFVPINAMISDTRAYQYYVQRWADWMVFSNNWIYNSTTNSWWRLGNPNSLAFYWAIPGYNTSTMYFASQHAAVGSTEFLFTYDRDVPCNDFTWLSLPIKLPSEDRIGRVREVVIRASNPYADAAPAISTFLINEANQTDTLAPWTMTPGVNTVQEFRMNAGLHATSVAVSLHATGTLYAPVIHSISIGYAPREHLGAD